jgi:hypothetical protein
VTDYLTLIEVLADTQTFDFDHLTPWLRSHVTPE